MAVTRAPANRPEQHSCSWPSTPARVPQAAAVWDHHPDARRTALERLAQTNALGCWPFSSLARPLARCGEPVCGRSRSSSRRSVRLRWPRAVMRVTPSRPAVTRMRKAVGCTRTACGRYPAKSRRGRCSRASAWFMRYRGPARLSRSAMRHAAAVCVSGLFTASRSRFGARPSVISGVTEAMASRLSLTARAPRW